MQKYPKLKQCSFQCYELSSSQCELNCCTLLDLKGKQCLQISVYRHTLGILCNIEGMYNFHMK